MRISKQAGQLWGTPGCALVAVDCCFQIVSDVIVFAMPLECCPCLFNMGFHSLKNILIKLLGQPSSSSCCERNWSTYKFIHFATRNKITPQRAEDLVFVHTNLRLLARRKDSYKEGPSQMWDLEGDQFDSLDESNLGRLEFEDLSVDEPSLEGVLFDNVHEGGDVDDDDLDVDDHDVLVVNCL
ncbi:hypothetical protein ACLB2K_032043 [Fragaria x ananassa]